MMVETIAALSVTRVPTTRSGSECFSLVMLRARPLEPIQTGLSWCRKHREGMT